MNDFDFDLEICEKLGKGGEDYLRRAPGVGGGKEV